MNERKSKIHWEKQMEKWEKKARVKENSILISLASVLLHVSSFLWCDKYDYFSMFCKMFYMILLTVTLKRSFHIHVVNILPQGLCTKVPYHSCGVKPLQVISWGLCFLCSRDFVILWSFIPHDFNLIHKFISLYLVKGMWYLCLSQGLCSTPVIFHSLWCLSQNFSSLSSLKWNMGTKQFFHFFHSLFFFYVGNCSNAKFKTRSNSSWCWLWNRRFCFLHGEGMTCDKSLFIVQCIYEYSSGLFSRLLDKPLELLVKRKCWYFTKEIRKINFILIEISFLTTLFFEFLMRWVNFIKF